MDSDDPNSGSEDVTTNPCGELTPDQMRTEGKFTSWEDDILIQAIEKYFEVNFPHMHFDDAAALLIDKPPRGAWHQIAQSLPRRTEASVQSHGRRLFSYTKYISGSFSKEEIEEVIRLVENYGTKWSLIGEKLCRFPQACCHVYRYYHNPVNKGPWTKEEDELFLKAVMDHYGGQMPSPEDKIPFARILEKIPTLKRPYSSARSRWAVFVAPKKIHNLIATSVCPWTERDTKYLLVKICLKQPRRTEDISLGTKISKQWQGNVILCKYRQLLNSIIDSRVLSLQEVLIQLMKKYNITHEKLKKISQKKSFIEW